MSKQAALILALLGATLVPAHAPAQTAPPPAQAAALAVLPGDDFYNYVNGEWQARTEIPADRSSWGAFAAMAETSNERIAKLIEAAAADPKARPDVRQVADYYRAFMDEAAIEQRGIAPLKPALERIAAIGDKAALVRALGASLRADVDPLNDTNFHTENLFGLWVSKSLNDPAHNVPYLLQGGLGMPDRAYYLDAGERMQGYCNAYRQHIAAMFRLAGVDDADARAARVFDLEMKIAQSHTSREVSADVQKANNTWTLTDFRRKAPGIDWKTFFDSARLNDAQRFIVWHPGAVSGAARLVADGELAQWKDYLAFHQISRFAGVLPKAFGEEYFNLHAKVLAGTPQQALRWKRALAATNAALDEAVGRMYVERYFPAEHKARVQKMVANIIAAFDRRIEKLDWMAPATRAQARQKLKSLYVGVGYPDHWMSYSGLQVSPTDAYGNAQRAEEFAYARAIAKLKKKPDNTEWAMPPHLVNAVNLPVQNAINMPAAILQPPFFDGAASDAVNYGAIGSIIGHEISHSFDDQGSQFDAQGRLRDWWTKADMEHFKAASSKLVAQFSAYKPFPDLAVNGQLTLSENLADLAGVAASLDGYHASFGGKPVPPEADREFFTGFARAWQTKVREPALRQRILTDGHAPAPYRTAIVRNIDAWYKAFDVKPGQTLYLAPEERVRVW